MPTQSELKARRVAEKKKDLENRKKQAEKAVKTTTGLLKGASSAIQKRREREKQLMESL